MDKKDPKKLIKEHEQLTHSEMMKVTSHVQREKDGWFLNTIMIENCEVPFRYKRKKKYKNLKRQRVNLTYYQTTETIAGMNIDMMKVIRIKVS